MTIPYGSGYKKQLDALRAERPVARAAGAPGLNCLVLGGGGREYALAWALARSRSVSTIDAMPGNAGTALFARNVETRDTAALERYVAASSIDLCIVGPDDLVAEGMGDVLRRCAISVVAPSREASRIEWSKAYAKELMDEAGVPTASWRAFPNADAARDALSDDAIVVKADGLAQGKGVVVARGRAQALEALATPGVGGGAVVLEELLEGPEASLHALVDGETVVALPPSQDHKRVGDGDTGPNTGGMGAVSPTPVLPDAEAQALADLLISPIARALVRRGTPYRGILFAGLIRARDGWRVLEFNARFGDPEAEVMLPRLEGDFGRLMHALAGGQLAEHVRAEPVRFNDRCAVDVVLCAEGYPGTPRVGAVIEGMDELPEGVYAMHGGTRRSGDRLVTSGGRVMHVVGTGASIAEARSRAYAGAGQIRFEGKFYRSDIAAGGIK